jgi:hypothetical protein
MRGCLLSSLFGDGEDCIYPFEPLHDSDFALNVGEKPGISLMTVKPDPPQCRLKDVIDISDFFKDEFRWMIESANQEAVNNAPPEELVIKNCGNRLEKLRNFKALQEG